VIDIVGVPHPYCISHRHVVYASDHFDGILGKEAIIDAEKHGIVCDICKRMNKKEGERILSYEEHEQALIVEVDDDRDLCDVEGLKDYLLSIKSMMVDDGYAGCAFKRKKKV